MGIQKKAALRSLEIARLRYSLSAPYPDVSGGLEPNITILPFKITRECFGSMTTPSRLSRDTPPFRFAAGGEIQKKAA